MHVPLSSVSRLSFSGDGTVEGYASLFGEIDQARDMMMPGAFTQTLKTRGLRKIPMLFQHDPPSRSASGSNCARIFVAFGRGES